MSDIDNALPIDSDDTKQKVEELQSKYDSLSKEIDEMESSRIEISKDIKEIHGEFEQINQNVEDILEKLNKLSNAYHGTDDEMHEGNRVTRSMSKLFVNPLRKAAVGTLSIVYAAADLTMEKTLSAKESLEDIIAEAQYLNKKKKMKPMENS